jgi:hypothetical protein
MNPIQCQLTANFYPLFRHFQGQLCSVLSQSKPSKIPRNPNKIQQKPSKKFQKSPRLKKLPSNLIRKFHHQFVEISNFLRDIFINVFYLFRFFPATSIYVAFLFTQVGKNLSIPPHNHSPYRAHTYSQRGGKN